MWHVMPLFAWLSKLEHTAGSLAQRCKTVAVSYLSTMLHLFLF
jgi:trans-2-enoyl-CoA reductase